MELSLLFKLFLFILVISLLFSRKRFKKEMYGKAPKDVNELINKYNRSEEEEFDIYFKN